MTNSDWIVSKGRYLYRKIWNKIKEFRGWFVAIEVNTGDYFIGRTIGEALKKGKAKHPDGKFFVTRVGEDVLGSRRIGGVRHAEGYRVSRG